MLMRCHGHHIPQHLLQQGRVVRQPVEVDLHTAMMIDAVASAPAFPPASAHFLSRQFGPAVRRRGTPLASVEQCNQLCCC
jgi:hypothetical protein